MRFFIYILIGGGITLADPYKYQSEWDRTVLAIAWPAYIVRDIVNELHRPRAEETKP